MKKCPHFNTPNNKNAHIQKHPTKKIPNFFENSKKLYLKFLFGIVNKAILDILTSQIASIHGAVEKRTAETWKNFMLNNFLELFFNSLVLVVSTVDDVVEVIWNELEAIPKVVVSFNQNGICHVRHVRNSLSKLIEAHVHRIGDDVSPSFLIFIIKFKLLKIFN